MQDDAFIHLRYAANLLKDHIISYNGAHPDYGTSSLLYVGLLAALYKFVASPILPRAVSSFFHILLFVGLVWALVRKLLFAPKIAWLFALLLLGIVSTPMSVRWLDDGMETSLALCLVAIVAFLTSRFCHMRHFSGRQTGFLFLLGFIATLTRIEYLLLFGIVTLTLLSAQITSANQPVSNIGKPERVSLSLGLRCTAPLAGSLLAASTIFVTMHSLVPDTAIAKASGYRGWYGTLGATASVFESSLSLGALFVILWLLTLVAVIVYKGKITIPILLVNSLLPTTIALSAIRGQEVQGIRYFLWTLLFSVLWNTLELRWSMPNVSSHTLMFLQICGYSVAVLLLLLQPIESTLLYREFRMRTQSIATFRAQHLEKLSSLKLVAYDIGYIGYFTGSQVCDMAGLVNGRERARLSSDQRVRICADENPQFAFLTGPGIGTLNNDLPLKDWSICSVYDLANLRRSDVHYLIASPAAAAQVCSAAGRWPQPVEPLLHP